MRELIVQTDVNVWSQVSAGIFCVCFIALIAWVYLPSRRSAYAKASRLPLD